MPKIPDNTIIHRFTVAVSVLGAALDMMRYDCCWPDTQEDSAKLERMGGSNRRPEDTHVTFAGLITPSIGRWRSFGCEVTRIMEQKDG